MRHDLHAVKIGAQAAVMRQYGLEKQALIYAGLVNRLRSGGAGGLVGGALGAAHGFITADPSSEGGEVTLKDRLSSAAKGGLMSGAAGAALGTFGATAEQYGLNRAGLKRMFSAVPQGARGRGLLGEIGQAGLFGSPVTAYNRYKEDLRRFGGSHGRVIGEQFRRAYLPAAGESGLGKGLHYVLTAGGLAMPAYQAMTTDDPDQRNKMLASLATGIVASPFTSQLGLPGTYVQQQLQNLAERVVARKPVSAQPDYAFETHSDVARTGKNIMRHSDYAFGD